MSRPSVRSSTAAGPWPGPAVATARACSPPSSCRSTCGRRRMVSCRNQTVTADTMELLQPADSILRSQLNRESPAEKAMACLLSCGRWSGGVGDAQMIFEHAATWAAVLGAVAYGSGDFLGGCASRRLATFSAVAIAQAVAVTFMLQNYALAQGPLPAGAQAWVSVAAGIAYAIGVISIYEGLGHGRIAIVASLCGLLSTVVPLAGDLVLGRSISSNELVGMVLCAAAAVLIVGASKASEIADRSAGPSASASQAGSFWCCRPRSWIDAARTGGRGPVHDTMRCGHDRGRSCVGPCRTHLIEVRCSGRPCAGRCSRDRGTGVRLDGDADTVHLEIVWFDDRRRASGTAGLLDMLGHVGYVHAATRGSMGVAAALVAIFPGVTVLLAALVLQERITRSQLFGFGLGTGGIIFISG